MKQIHFFALKGDLLPVLDLVESAGPLKYVRMGQFSTSDSEGLARGAEIPDLGIASTDSATSGRSFLVTRESMPVSIRPITGADAQRYAIDQLLNPDSIVFSPGGIWGNDVVLNGRIATVSDSVPAEELIRRFRSAIQKQFSKVRAFWVGPEAFARLQAGARLTASARSAREFDLAAVP